MSIFLIWSIASMTPFDFLGLLVEPQVRRDVLLRGHRWFSSGLPLTIGAFTGKSELAASSSTSPPASLRQSALRTRAVRSSLKPLSPAHIVDGRDEAPQDGGRAPPRQPAHHFADPVVAELVVVGRPGLGHAVRDQGDHVPRLEAHLAHLVGSLGQEAQGGPAFRQPASVPSRATR